jgi:hypothetical protein
MTFAATSFPWLRRGFTWIFNLIRRLSSNAFRCHCSSTRSSVCMTHLEIASWDFCPVNFPCAHFASSTRSIFSLVRSLFALLAGMFGLFHTCCTICSASSNCNQKHSKRKIPSHWKVYYVLTHNTDTGCGNWDTPVLEIKFWHKDVLCVNINWCPTDCQQNT